MLMFFKISQTQAREKGKSKTFGEIRKEGRLVKGRTQKESPCLEMLGTDDKSDISTFHGLQRLP